MSTDFHEKEHKISFRLTPTQYEKLCKLAEAEGYWVTPSDVLRRLIELAPDPGPAGMLRKLAKAQQKEKAG